MKKAILTLLLIFSIVLPVFAITPDEIIEIKPFYASDRIAAGSDFQLAIEMKLLKGWHIQSNAPSSEFAIPTEIIFEPLQGITIKNITFPEVKIEKLESVDLTVEYFDGTSYAIIDAYADTSIAQGMHALKGVFSYQGCKGRECLMPTKKDITFNLDIVPTGSVVETKNTNIFSQAGSTQQTATGTSASTDDITGMIKEKGLLLTLLLIFFGGLALNLTPCVYPLIPVTISYFGGLEHKGRRFANAFVYVMGITVTYSILGTFSALSGEMLGKQLTSPVVTIAIAALMIGLSLSMFGLYEIRVPQFIMKVIGGEARSGLIGTLVMGATMGIIAAPCIGPFIVGLLAYVAKLGDPFKGFLMFFVLSLGLGIPYLFLALFSGRISSLPRSGEWMIGIRRIFGFVLIAMAVYFLDPILSKKTYTVLFSLALFTGGTWLILFDRTGEKARGFHFFQSAIAIAMIVAGTWMIAPSNGSPSKITWIPYSDSVLSQAVQNKKPVIIDFFADWCIPCKELDEVTFSSKQVQRYADRFVFVKADLSSETDQEVESIKKQYDIKGVPTVVFLKPDGSEAHLQRLTGFEGPDEFVERMKSVDGALLK